MSLDFDKNPYWSDEEAQFWHDHMRDFNDLWWFPDNACGHPLGNGPRDAYIDLDLRAFIQVCIEGHLTKFPVVMTPAQDIAEGTLLEAG